MNNLVPMTPLQIRHASGDLYEVTCGAEHFILPEHEVIELVRRFRPDGTERQHAAFVRDLRRMRAKTKPH